MTDYTSLEHTPHELVAIINQLRVQNTPVANSLADGLQQQLNNYAAVANGSLAAPLLGWIPCKLIELADGYQCRWLYTAAREYAEPFFDETIGRCLNYPENAQKLKVVTSPDVLPHWDSSFPSVKPTAFIFHISRCGSTLLAQSLGLDEHNIVLAEVPFIDDVLRLAAAGTPGFNMDTVKAAINFYGQNRSGKKTQLFIKADSWHIGYLPLLRTWYPDVPFILLYRRPDEVMRSHQRKRGMHAVPGIVPDEVLGIAPASAEARSLDGHLIKVLERYLQAYIDAVQTDPKVLLLNYKEGIEPIMQRFFDFTGISVSDEALQKIRQRSKFDAKYPDKQFAEDYMEPGVTPETANLWLLYNTVEDLRKKQMI